MKASNQSLPREDLSAIPPEIVEQLQSLDGSELNEALSHHVVERDYDPYSLTKALHVRNRNPSIGRAHISRWLEAVLIVLFVTIVTAVFWALLNVQVNTLSAQVTSVSTEMRRMQDQFSGATIVAINEEISSLRNTNPTVVVLSTQVAELQATTTTLDQRLAAINAASTQRALEFATAISTETPQTEESPAPSEED